MPQSTGLTYLALALSGAAGGLGVTGSTSVMLAALTARGFSQRDIAKGLAATCTQIRTCAPPPSANIVYLIHSARPRFYACGAAKMPRLIAT